jgi:hypothetical protein
MVLMVSVLGYSSEEFPFGSIDEIGDSIGNPLPSMEDQNSHINFKHEEGKTIKVSDITSDSTLFTFNPFRHLFIGDEKLIVILTCAT